MEDSRCCHGNNQSKTSPKFIFCFLSYENIQKRRKILKTQLQLWLGLVCLSRVECGHEDCSVEVECGMPPLVREVDHLQ